MRTQNFTHPQRAVESKAKNYPSGGFVEPGEVRRGQSMTKDFEERKTHGFPTRPSRHGVNLRVFQAFQHQLDFGRGEGVSIQAFDTVKELQRGEIGSNRLAFQVSAGSSPRNEASESLQGDWPFCKKLGGC